MTLSDEASRHLDQYLQSMRASVDDSDSAEIEQDIRDHIDAELGERPAPVSADELDAVLERLGSPSQWMTSGSSQAIALPRAVSTEDWLSYGSLALLVIGFVAPIFLPVSWLIARWTLARLEQQGRDRDARRWLLYPPLVVVSIVIALLALFGPFGLFAELGTIAAQRLGVTGSHAFPPVEAVAVAFACLGAYWIILSAALSPGERAVRFVFHPFAGRFRRGHAWWLTGAGTVVLLCAAIMFFGFR